MKKQKTRSMKRLGMLGAWNDQRSIPASNDLAFGERFGLIVDAEQRSPDNRRLKRSLTQAKLKVSQACLEGVDYAANRKLDKAVVAQSGRSTR